MIINLKRQNKKHPYQLLVSNERGYELTYDAKPGIGGKAEGFGPMETVLAALGGCSSIDIIMILKKQKVEPAYYEVRCEATRKEDETPSIFDRIVVHYTFSREVRFAQAKRAVELSLYKYCSVAKILEATAEIDYKIHFRDE